jgi:hypothetical protein
MMTGKIKSEYWLKAAMATLVAIAALGLCTPMDAKVIEVARNGAISLDGLNLRTIYFGKKWSDYRDQNRGVVVPDKGYPKTHAGGWLFKGAFRTDGGEFAFSEELKKKAGNAWSLQERLHHSQGIYAETIALALTLPVDDFAGKSLIFDGDEVILPLKRSKHHIVTSRSVGQIGLCSAGGKIVLGSEPSGLQAVIQDERWFSGNSFTLRIFFTPYKGLIKDAALNLAIAFQPYLSTPVSLKPVANMGLEDETADDRKGGWTDQGPNDLRSFKPGRRKLGGVTFDIPESKSCLVMRGPSRDYFPEHAKLDCRGFSGDCLYLLHGIAWAPSSKSKIGSLMITYADGSVQTLEVNSAVDVGNWWTPFPLKNGAVVWTAENPRSYIGLYLSKFKIRNKPLQSIDFVSTGKAVWMLTGLSLGEDIPMTSTTNFYVVKGREWQEFEHSIDVKPGSILDFSGMVEAPAGKHGPLVTRNGHFEFESLPGVKQRFYGTNICFSAVYQDKTLAEKTVNDLAAMGYNTIRLHHYDRDLIDRKAPDSYTFDASQLDRLDYLFSLLKRRGMYVAIDLYTIRPTKKGEIKAVGGRVLALQEYKVYAALVDEVFENWKRFAARLLTHVNPYTGLAWKDDPALFNICLINENNLNGHWNTTSASSKLYKRAFREWLKDRKLSFSNENQRTSLFNRFLVEMQTRLFSRCRDYVRSLGVKARISDLNMQSYLPLQLVRNQMDYVDNHVYWDHPTYIGGRGKWPCAYKNLSAVSQAAQAPANIMPSRIFGKAFSLSEYHFCAPNRFRGEGGPLMGAYAALQDWDVIHRFAYSHWNKNMHQPKAQGRFDIITDPISLLSDRIAVLLFRGGGLKPATTEVPYVVSSGCLNNPDAFTWKKGDAPEAYARLGLAVKIGSVADVDGAIRLPDQAKCAVSAENVDEAKLSGKPFVRVRGDLADSLASRGLIPAGLIDEKTGVYRSETGQIELNRSAGTLEIVSEESECFVFKAKNELSGKAVTLKNAGGFGVFSFHARDGKALSDSSRILVFHLTDVKNTMASFRDSNHSILCDPGKLPFLVKKGSGTVTLRNRRAADLQLWALNMKGERIGKIPVTKEEGTISFNLLNQ